MEKSDKSLFTHHILIGINIFMILKKIPRDEIQDMETYMSDVLI